MSTTVNTVTLSDTVVQGAALVGRLVTRPYDETQYVIYSVEGPDYYAFRSDFGAITVDPSMTRAPWITEPVAMILPTYAKIGEGYGIEVPVSALVRGVSLAKTWV